MSNPLDSQKFMIRKPLEEKLGEPQQGRMKVGSQIIRHLSKGIYSTPAMAIKELVSNAFDADAPEVRIETNPVSGSIIIHDTGIGMDYKDFDENFTYISRSSKEDKKTTDSGRPLIGKLGIGFIAVSELCDTMIISSAKKKSTTKFTAIIDFTKFKDSKNKDVEFSDISEFTLTNYQKENLDESYTHIELLGLTEGFKNKLRGISAKGIHEKISKNSFNDVVKEIWKTQSHINIAQKYGPYWEFVMHLASIIPVKYLDDGPIRKIANIDQSIIKPIKNMAGSFNFTVYLDDMELRKPYLFPTQNKIDNGEFTVLPFNDTFTASNGKKVSYIGYMYSQDGGILVDDWRGLIIRIKNTSIGIIDHSFLGYPYEGDTLYYKWTFGEIYVMEGLDDAMNVDRATFKTADPEYYEFAKSVHRKLKKEVFNSVQQRWHKRNKLEKEHLESVKMNWRKHSLSKTFSKPFDVLVEKRNFEIGPVKLDRKNQRLMINTINDVLTSFPARERTFLQDILVAVTIARERYPTNPIKQENLLYELLKELGEKYPKTKGRVKSKTSESN